MGFANLVARCLWQQVYSILFFTGGWQLQSLSLDFESKAIPLQCAGLHGIFSQQVFFKSMQMHFIEITAIIQPYYLPQIGTLEPERCKELLNIALDTRTEDQSPCCACP